MSESVICPYHDVFMELLAVAFGVEEWVCIECKREEANAYWSALYRDIQAGVPFGEGESGS